MACYSKWDPGNCGCACTLQVAVKGCLGLAVGSGLTVDIKVGGSTIDTQTTNSSGVATFTQPAGTYDVVVTDGRGTSRWTTQTFTSKSLTCGGSTSVTLTSPKAGFHCWVCGDPLKDTLNYTDANGTGTLVYDGANVNGSGWYGCGALPSQVGVITSLAAGVCIPTTGTATVNYAIRFGTTNDASNYWALNFTNTQAATVTCSSGTLNLNAGIPPSCAGYFHQEQADSSGSFTCPPSFSLTWTMPAVNGLGRPNPGAGSITITE